MDLDGFEPMENEPVAESTSIAAATSTEPNILAPKAPVVRRPRQILKAEHLMSKKGIAALPQVMSEVKFKGKGHELEDLKLLMFRAKHWAHRLFPALTFEDFVEKAEQIGNKRPVQLFVKKIRHNDPLYFGDEIVHSDHSDEDQPALDPLPPVEANQSALEFDRLFKDYAEDTNRKQAETEVNKPPKSSNTFDLDDDFEDDLGDDFFDNIPPKSSK